MLPTCSIPYPSTTLPRALATMTTVPQHDVAEGVGNDDDQQESGGFQECGCDS